jgi:acylphosphatase
MTAVQFARGLSVSGTVRNLGSGEVELVVAGEAGEVEGLVGRLREHFEAEARTVEEGVDLGVDLGLRTATMSGPGIRIIH